jgi:hypothetical protein
MENYVYVIDRAKKLGCEGLIGVETATEYWCLSTYESHTAILLYDNHKSLEESKEYYFDLGYLFVPDVNTVNTVKLAKGLYITDREQTVCDMIRYKRHEFHLYEAVMSAYEDGEVDMDRLKKLAKSYGILDEMDKIYEKAVEAFKEDNS